MADGTEGTATATAEGTAGDVGQQGSSWLTESSQADTKNDQINLEENSAKGTFEFGKELDVKPLSEKEKAFLAGIPQEHHTDTLIKEIVKKENPVAEMAKQLKNLQQLMGQRQTNIAVPAEDAPPEAKKAFYKSLGVPEKADEYQLQPVAWAEEDKEIGAQIEANRDKGLMDHMKKTALEANLTPKQLQKVVENFETYTLSRAKENVAKQQAEWAKYDQEFANQMAVKHGTSVEQIKEIGRKLVREHTDDQEKQVLRTYSNPQAVVLSSLLKRIHSAYIQQDGFGSRDTGVGHKPMSQSEAMELMASEAYQNFRHHQHEEVVARVNAHFGTNQKRK